ncbi:MAG: hypothetical protein ABL974_21365, partial [Prosthecobacter sp.]
MPHFIPRRELHPHIELSMTPEELSHIATTAGVLFAAYQILLSRQQAQTSFEDALAKEYRDLVSKMPTKALLGEDLTDAEHAEAIDEFYHYFDLSNGQIFLRQINRVRPTTWKFWCDGIRTNLKRPAFKTAW